MSIKRPPVTYGLRERGAEWQVCHGNRIIARYSGETAEKDATDHVRRLINPNREPKE